MWVCACVLLWMCVSVSGKRGLCQSWNICTVCHKFHLGEICIHWFRYNYRLNLFSYRCARMCKAFYLHLFIKKSDISGDLRRGLVCFYGFVCRSATATNKLSAGFESSAFREKQTNVSFLFWSGASLISHPPPCDNTDWSPLTFPGACTDRYYAHKHATALGMQTIHLHPEQNVQRVTFSSMDFYIQ